MITKKAFSKKSKSIIKKPVGKYIKMPDGSKHFVIDLGYKTNAVQMLKEDGGR